MGKTFTAHIAIGIQNEGGILPTHVAWLFENSRHMWMLEPTALRLTGESTRDDRPGSQGLIRWIPEGPDHILEDGLLLIAVHLDEQGGVWKLASELIPRLVEMDTTKTPDGIEHVCDLNELSYKDPAAAEHLARLRNLSKESMPSTAKLIVTTLEGSSIERQLPILERYPIELEVCTVTYSRQRLMGAWGPVDPSSPPSVRGSLEPRPDAPGHRYTAIR
jgi:hypothetical protein